MVSGQIHYHSYGPVLHLNLLDQLGTHQVQSSQGVHDMPEAPTKCLHCGRLFVLDEPMTFFIVAYCSAQPLHRQHRAVGFYGWETSERIRSLFPRNLVSLINGLTLG